MSLRMLDGIADTLAEFCVSEEIEITLPVDRYIKALCELRAQTSHPGPIRSSVPRSFWYVAPAGVSFRVVRQDPPSFKDTVQDEVNELGK